MDPSFTGWPSVIPNAPYYLYSLAVATRTKDSSPDRDQGARFQVCEGTEDNSIFEDDPEKLRLHRRDTPHHLKSKRIDNQDTNKDTVASLLAQALREQKDSHSSHPDYPDTNLDDGERPKSITRPIEDEMRSVEIIDISFQRAGQGLGLSIAGGLGSTPYKENDHGIFISRVTEGGQAYVSGLRKDDKILSVNGHSCLTIDHYEAVGILKAAGSFLHIRVEREVYRGTHSNGRQSSMKKAPRVGITVPDSISLPIIHQGSNFHPQKSPLPPKPSGNADQPIKQINVTLVRDHMGLGFSIAGGKGAEPYEEGSEFVFISKIAEGGSASRNGKLLVGDKIVLINNVDVTDAEHEQVVKLLSGREQFVRLTVERKLTSGMFPPNYSLPPTPTSSKGVSPRVFGLAKPSTAIYSPSSYMANRPSYIRTREPGQYALNTLTESVKSNTLPSPSSKSTGSYRGFEIPTEVGKTENNVALIPSKESEIAELATKFPPAPTKPGVTTEKITKTTYTEQTVQRVTTNEVKPKIEEVLLVKSGGPLGLSIIGGLNHSCIPFGNGEHGIFISKIIKGGAAYRTGKLRMGDRILEVNDVDLRGASHQDAVVALVTQADQLKIVVQHDPLPPGFKEVKIEKLDHEMLGLVVKGGLRGRPGNPLDLSDEGIFISKITEGSCAYNSEDLKVGQRIIEVNGQSLLGASHQEAVDAFRNVENSVVLLVCDGWNTTGKSGGTGTAADQGKVKELEIIQSVHEKNSKERKRSSDQRMRIMP